MAYESVHSPSVKEKCDCIKTAYLRRELMPVVVASLMFLFVAKGDKKDAESDYDRAKPHPHCCEALPGMI